MHPDITFADLLVAVICALVAWGVTEGVFRTFNGKD